jgi:hypothetical protein
MFTDEGEQAPGAKTIFYVLRMLSLLVSGSAPFTFLAFYFLFIHCRFRFFYPLFVCIILILFQQNGFREGQDLHEIHCKKITQFYARITAKASSSGGQTNGVNVSLCLLLPKKPSY